MIRTDSTNNSLIVQRKKQEADARAEALRLKCEELAQERYGKDKLAALGNANRGLFYLPILDDEGGIVKMAVLRPIDRRILSYATTKMEEEGLYIFLELVLRECWLEGDEEIKEDDEYFLPAAQQLNKLIEGRKAALVKR